MTKKESPTALAKPSVARQALNRFRRTRSYSAPPTTGRRRLLEEHFRVDPQNKKVVLPGLPKHGDDWARDLHDFFNLVILIPVVVLNIMNWNWDMLLKTQKNKTFEDYWTGEWFNAFFIITVMYFLVDLMWIIIVPNCVRSPATIVQHHTATLLYLLIPYYVPEFRCFMGACMSVEVNTWFLIARRVFNKQGFPPWIIGLPTGLSIRIKLISIFFYTTWISIRCILYPYLMWKFIQQYNLLSAKTGSRISIWLITIPLHSVFCLLNLKWTYDLIMSKIRYWKRKGKKGSKYDASASKGL